MSRTRRLLTAGAVTAALTVTLGGWYSTHEHARGHTRTYYVAADTVTWDYVPGAIDGITGRPYVDSGYFRNAPPRPMSTRYLKALYREYADSTFTTLVARPPAWRHLGYLGPLLRAQVGDTIRVVFRNNAPFPAGMHPHGVLYAKDSEGAKYADGTSGKDTTDDGVPPGGTHVYVWPVPERAGPGPGDHRSSVLWMYHSHTDEVKDVYSGLIGPMIVSARGSTRPDGTPKDVDRELVVMFGQNHEEMTWFARGNLPDLSREPPRSGPNAIFPWFVKFSINGYSHGSMPLADLTVRKGERVRWYLFSSTGDFDFHSPHWHGNTGLDTHLMRTDVVSMDPMQMAIVDMTPDNVGTWLFHCHVADHLTSGMQARFVVGDAMVAKR